MFVFAAGVLEFGSRGPECGCKRQKVGCGTHTTVLYDIFEDRVADFRTALGEAVDAAFAGLDEQSFGDESLERRNPFREARRVESLARTQAEDRPFLAVLRR